MKAQAKFLADNNRATMLKMQAEHWPANIAPMIDKVVAEMAKQQPYLRAMARAKNHDTFNGVYTSYPMPEGSAELVRQKLGLGEVPQV